MFSTYRFPTDLGTILVLLRHDGATATVEVYEEQAMLAAKAENMTDDEFRRAPMTIAARNRFGTGRILSILRSVMQMHPDVHGWRWERKTGVACGKVRLT